MGWGLGPLHSSGKENPDTGLFQADGGGGLRWDPSGNWGPIPGSRDAWNTVPHPPLLGGTHSLPTGRPRVTPGSRGAFRGPRH